MFFTTMMFMYLDDILKKINRYVIEKITMQF